MWRRVWTLLFGRDWRNPVGGLVVGIGLACPAYAVGVTGPALPFATAAALLVSVAGVAYVLRSDPGLLAAWVATALPFYLLVSPSTGCTGYGPAVAGVCVQQPPWVDQLTAAVAALLVSVLGYLVRRALPSIPRNRRGVSRGNRGGG